MASNRSSLSGRMKRSEWLYIICYSLAELYTYSLFCRCTISEESLDDFAELNGCVYYTGDPLPIFAYLLQRKGLVIAITF